MPMSDRYPAWTSCRREKWSQRMGTAPPICGSCRLKAVESGVARSQRLDVLAACTAIYFAIVVPPVLALLVARVVPPDISSEVFVVSELSAAVPKKNEVLN